MRLCVVDALSRRRCIDYDPIPRANRVRFLSRTIARRRTIGEPVTFAQFEFDKSTPNIRL